MTVTPVTAATWVELGALVLASATVFEGANALYVRACADGRALATGAWSALCSLVRLVGLFGVLTISAWLIVPEIVGAFLGGAAVVHWRRR